MKFLLLLLLFWIVAKVLRNLTEPVRRQAAPDPRRTNPNGRITGGELVQDPQCGVYVPKDTALRGSGGRYFCSESCRDAFARKGG